MSEPTYVTVIARMVVPVEGRPDVEFAALGYARQYFPNLAWSVEHVEIPWGT